jgi:hypothetical protein
MAKVARKSANSKGDMNSSVRRFDEEQPQRSRPA